MEYFNSIGDRHDRLVGGPQFDEETFKNKNLLRLRNLVQGKSDFEEAIAQVVLTLRAEKASWAEIGECLGVTRQAAQSKYGKLVGTTDVTENDGVVRTVNVD